MGKEGYEGMERRSVEGAKGERDLQLRVEWGQEEKIDVWCWSAIGCACMCEWMCGCVGVHVLSLIHI